MNTREYIENVLKTESNDFEKIGDRLLCLDTVRLLHAAMGLVTEAGEFMNALKTHIFYGKSQDTTNLKEELGDLLWYIAIALNELGEKSFEGIMNTNIAKTKARYGDKFGEMQAKNRDLVKEREILENQGIRFNTVQFKGESAYDAIINNYSLNIEEQISFDNYLIRKDIPQSSALNILEEAYDDWSANYVGN